VTWTSVVSYHTDPDTCGVARFSAQLAQRLGVPLAPLLDTGQWGLNPLLSLKWHELVGVSVRACLPHDQLWHDEPPLNYAPTGRVWKLYELGVPALVERRTFSFRAPVFFTFGMAHKLDADRFQQLRARFPGWELWVSTADHEGAGPSKVPGLLRVWGPHALNLGHLTDDGLSLVWPHVTVFVAFFRDGLRANNSSVHAALNAQKPVITNWGPQTPEDLRACTHDLTMVTRETPLVSRCDGSPYTWDRLLKELGCDRRT
jgi:hypothetical protein